MRELEIIQHRQIDGLTVLLNTVDYRTPHVHSEWELIWVLDQRLVVTSEQSQFLVDVFSQEPQDHIHKIGVEIFITDEDNSGIFLRGHPPYKADEKIFQLQQ